jgi:hypothetical protein
VSRSDQGLLLIETLSQPVPYFEQLSDSNNAMMLWILHVVLGLLSCSNSNDVGPHDEIRCSHCHNARRLLATADDPTDLLSENGPSEQFEGNKT